MVLRIFKGYPRIPHFSFTGVEISRGQHGGHFETNLAANPLAIWFSDVIYVQQLQYVNVSAILWINGFRQQQLERLQGPLSYFSPPGILLSFLDLCAPKFCGSTLAHLLVRHHRLAQFFVLAIILRRCGRTAAVFTASLDFWCHEGVSSQFWSKTHET